ncbi:MAG: prepilin-type N-terminal cleavage/methylation domain-containing protein [Fervidobacterium sp.]|nr:prepilin-type N-terminal cleavage/methylation domain-containing protein [Fervidobacterium sp.]
MRRKGYTFVEFLIVLILISIFFSILIIITDSTMKAYNLTRSTLQTLYAQSHIDFTFDMLEGELKWVGSGSNLLRGERSGSELRKPNKTEVYQQISDKLWLQDSIDIEKTSTGFIIYITYVVASPVKFFYDSTTGTCRAISEGYIDSPDWSIVTRALVPSSEHYVPTLVKLKYYYNDSGVYRPVTGRLKVTPDLRFLIREVDPSNPSVERNLAPTTFPTTSTQPGSAPNELFITPISKFSNVSLNTGYTTRSFRQVQIEYNSQTKEITVRRLIPIFEPSPVIYNIKLLDNVESLQGSLVYYSSNGLSELRFDNRNDWNTYKNGPELRNIKDSIVGMKFTITWRPSWKLVNDEYLTKTRLIIIPKSIQ